jgi:hypothetical protein
LNGEGLPIVLLSLSDLSQSKPALSQEHGASRSGPVFVVFLPSSLDASNEEALGVTKPALAIGLARLFAR